MTDATLALLAGVQATIIAAKHVRISDVCEKK